MHIQLTNDLNSGFGTVAVRLHQLDETAGCRAGEYKTVATQFGNRIFLSIGEYSEGVNSPYFVDPLQRSTKSNPTIGWNIISMR